MSPQWPFLGREEELHHVQTILTAGDSLGAVLAGKEGVGKTRLALEFLRWAEGAGMATAQVRGTQAAASIPFGAMAPLLPADPIGEGWQGVPDRADLLRRFAAVLLEGAGGRRLVLCVDDAHLLDDASTTLIQQLAINRSVWILATIRTGEPMPDPIMDLWRDNLAERVNVVGLSSETIEELLSFSLEGTVDRATVTRFAVRCQGNLLFLRELVLGALQGGALRKDAGIWHLVGPLSPSDRLVELVESRLGRLPPEERGLLELMAFGEPLGLAELKAVADVALAETLERKDLLSGQRDGRRLQVRLAHPIYGDVLRARTPTIRVPALACTLAEVVESTGARRRDDIVRVATWRLDGGGADPDLMLKAATAARWRYDFPLAERLARAAVDAGAGFDGALLTAQLMGLQGRGAEAEEQLANLAPQAMTDAQRGIITVTRLESFFFRGLIDERLPLATEAEITIADQSWLDDILARRSIFVLYLEGPRAAMELLAPLLQRAQGRALVWACMIASLSLYRMGRIRESLETSALGHRVHITLAEPLEWGPWMHHVFHGDALAQAGRLDEARAFAMSQYRQAVAEGSIEAQALFAPLLSTISIEKGSIKAAATYGREGAALAQQLGRPILIWNSLVSLATALALGGQTRKAKETLDTINAIGLATHPMWAADLAQARAWTAASAGDLPSAHQLLQDGAVQASEIGDLVGEAAALHGLARLGRAKPVVDRLAELARQADGEMVSARAAHAHALSSARPELLERCSATFEAIGANLLAAEAAADATVRWQKLGNARMATASARRADNLARRCDGAATPALQMIATGPRLTRAERKAAMLAAAGFANKELAAQLGVSIRTVESQLHSVYEKLGISGRNELSGALEHISWDVEDGGPKLSEE